MESYLLLEHLLNFCCDWLGCVSAAPWAAQVRISHGRVGAHHVLGDKLPVSSSGLLKGRERRGLCCL